MRAFGCLKFRFRQQVPVEGVVPVRIVTPNARTSNLLDEPPVGRPTSWGDYRLTRFGTLWPVLSSVPTSSRSEEPPLPPPRSGRCGRSLQGGDRRSRRRG